MASKNKMVSYLFVILGLLVMAGAAYLIVSYATVLLGAIVDFVTTNDFAKLQQCGVNTPEQFNQVKADLTGVILPFMYLGIPLLFLVISAIMFMAGYYYHKGRHEDESWNKAELEKKIVHKVVKRMESSKPNPATPEEYLEPEQEAPESEPAESVRKRR
jgi:hypothetical protein